jgi:hypothetical protein
VLIKLLLVEFIRENSEQRYHRKLRAEETWAKAFNAEPNATSAPLFIARKCKEGSPLVPPIKTDCNTPHAMWAGVYAG